VSAVMLWRSFTMSAMRVTGTRKAIASLFMLNPSGVMNSSRRISPGMHRLQFLLPCSSLPSGSPLLLAGECQTVWFSREADRRWKAKRTA